MTLFHVYPSHSILLASPSRQLTQLNLSPAKTCILQPIMHTHPYFTHTIPESVHSVHTGSCSNDHVTCSTIGASDILTMIQLVLRCISNGMIQKIFTIISTIEIFFTIILKFTITPKITIIVGMTGSYHLAHHPPITYLPSTGGHLCTEQFF